MLSTDHTSLSDDQKRIVMAFNAAALYIHGRLLGLIQINDEAIDLEELFRDRTGEQANSLIAHEAKAMIDGLSEDYFTADTLDAFSSAMKNAGNQSPERYYIEAILATNNQDRKASLAEECRKKVLIELLVRAEQLKFLPTDFMHDQLPTLDF